MLESLKKMFGIRDPKSVAKTEEIEVAVAGVTFKNGRKSRQAILRKIKYRDPPFDKRIDITLQEYDFEGKRAIGVYANGEQIGSIKSTDSPLLFENQSKQMEITDIKIIGGEDGKNYGARIKIAMK